MIRKVAYSFILLTIFVSCQKEEFITLNGLTIPFECSQGMPVAIEMSSAGEYWHNPYEFTIILSGKTYRDLGFGLGNYHGDSDFGMIILTDSLEPKEYEICGLATYDAEHYNTSCRSIQILPQKSHTDSIDFVYIDGGSLQMGSSSGNNDELPVKEIIISPFYMGRYEITVKQFCEFLNQYENLGYNHSSERSDNGVRYCSQFVYHDYNLCDNGYGYTKQLEYIDFIYVPIEGKENHPIVNVSWFGAKLFCAWAGCRLPTEAEWEWAAKGGILSSGSMYSGSNIADSIAWTANNSGKVPHNVGELQPNELGLYDMTGNAMEWVNDIYKMYDDTTTFNGWIKYGGDRNNVIRGGGYRSEPYRNSQRDYDFDANITCEYGFRVCKDIN